MGSILATIINVLGFFLISVSSTLGIITSAYHQALTHDQLCALPEMQIFYWGNLVGLALYFFSLAYLVDLFE